MSKKSDRALIVKIFAILLAIYYGYVLLKTSIFTRMFAENHMRGLDLVPFGVKSPIMDLFKSETYKSSDALLKISGHILMFVPLGFLAPFLHAKFKNYLTVAGISIFISLVIEILQYLTKTGITSVEHLILNFVGATCGFLIYKALRFAFLYG